MVPVRLARLNILEITQVTVRCQKCGFGVIVDLAGGKLAMTRCPSCGTAFGEDVEEVFYRLREAFLTARASREKFRVEFDVVEETSESGRAS